MSFQFTSWILSSCQHTQITPTGYVHQQTLVLRQLACLRHFMLLALWIHQIERLEQSRVVHLVYCCVFSSAAHIITYTHVQIHTENLCRAILRQFLPVCNISTLPVHLVHPIERLGQSRVVHLVYCCVKGASRSRQFNPKFANPEMSSTSSIFAQSSWSKALHALYTPPPAFEMWIVL